MPRGKSTETPRPEITRISNDRLLVWRPPLSGVLSALVFFAASLVPSLLPRPWYLQGMVSGVGIALGYGLGTAAGAAVRPLRENPTSRTVRSSLLVMAAGVMLWMTVVHYRWQVDVRRLMDMEGGAAAYLLVAILTGSAVGYLAVVAARLVRRASRIYLRLLARVMPRGLSLVAGFVTFVLLMVVVFDLLIAGRLVATLNEAYLASDRRFDVDVDQPISSVRAGGPGSLIDWERMGRQGRSFVTQAPDLEKIENFSDGSAVEPIRVYAGLQSAPTAEERAQLAVSELERTGAFEREILVLIAPTGTGWIDPYAVNPLEYMYNGDTAAVAIQYSHLPSWVLIIGNQEPAVDASRALFEAVTERLRQAPPSSRPRLLLYGESLGSFGLEQVFDGIDGVERQTDGVLWVGPPRFNRIWQQLVSERQTDSPIWRPVYEEGETVRFGRDGDALLAVEGAWLSPRVVYLQHASDPITWLSVDLLFERPEWMDEPRGPDVSHEMPYIPVVTFWQLAVDLVIGTSAPIGHGHKFGLAQAEAWSLIVPPEDWSQGDTERLLAVVVDESQ